MDNTENILLSFGYTKKKAKEIALNIKQLKEDLKLQNGSMRITRTLKESGHSNNNYITKDSDDEETVKDIIEQLYEMEFNNCQNTINIKVIGLEIR